MKAFTDIEQSKKLAKILPIDSADAFYDMAEPEKRQVPIIGHPDNYYDMDGWAIPCRSLTALLDILPEGTRLLKSATGDTYHCDCPKGNIDKWYDDPVDACVEMILKLKEKESL